MDGAWLLDSTYDPGEMIEKMDVLPERERVRRRMQAVYQFLTPVQKETVLALSEEGVTEKAYAKQQGVSQAAISARLSGIRKKYERVSKKISE